MLGKQHPFDRRRDMGDTKERPSGYSRRLHKGKRVKFIRDTLVTFSTQIIAVVLGIGVSVVIARVLGPGGKGAYSLIILVPTLLALVGNLGIGGANVYFGGSRKHNWTDLSSNSRVLALLLGTFLASAVLAYLFVVNPSFLSGLALGGLVLASLVVPLSLMVTYFTSILLGQDRIKEYNLVTLAQSGTLLMLVVILLLAVKGGVFSTIAAWAGATLVAAVFAILLVRRTTTIRWSFHRQPFRDSVKFGVKGYLGSAIQFLNYRLDMLLVAMFMGTTFVGYYSVSVAMAEALWYLPAAVGTVIFARTPGMKAEDANRSTPRICRNTLFLTIMAGLLLFILSRYIILLLFGSAFLPALEPLWLLLPGIVALSVPKVLAPEISGRGKPIVGTIAAGVSLAVNIPLNIVLIPRIGISGAALASTASYAVSALVTLVFFLKISKNSWVDTLLFKREDLQLYVRALSTARHFDVRHQAAALSKQALSLLNPGFWTRESVGLNPTKGGELDSVEHRSENVKSETDQ